MNMHKGDVAGSASHDDLLVWAEERIEQYVDESLPGEERERFDRLLAERADLATEVRLAKEIQGHFRAMNGVACPDTVSRRVTREVHSIARKEKLDDLRGIVASLLRSRRRLGYIASGFAVFCVALVLLLVMTDQRPAPQPEVAQALEDVKWTLALVSNMGSETAGVVRSDVVDPLLAGRMNRSLEALGAGSPTNNR